MDVIKYIQHYCEVRGIEKYDIKSKVLTKVDFAKVQTFAPGIAFFYKFYATGQIDNVANINANLLYASTSNEFYDFTNIVNIKDFGTIQQAESDFVFSTENMLTLHLKEGVNALFSKIYTAQLYYMYVTIIPTVQKRKPMQIEVDVNNI